jgi:hypothetical protein
VYKLCTAVYTVRRGRKLAFSVFFSRFTYQKRLPNCELCTVYAASDCTQFVSSCRTFVFCVFSTIKTNCVRFFKLYTVHSTQFENVENSEKRDLLFRALFLDILDVDRVSLLLSF